MSQRTYEHLFQTALSRAVEAAEQEFSTSLPRNFIVELHGLGSVGERMDVSSALERLFINDTTFYRVVDVAIRQITSDTAVAFVRVSGHSPGPWEKTWDPDQLGPFKVLTAKTLDRD